MNIKILDLPPMISEEVSEHSIMIIADTYATYKISIKELRKSVSIWWRLWYWITGLGFPKYGKL